jgi:hypothetical protein
MQRLLAAACLFLSLSGLLGASEVCVVCDKPAATYRCTLEQFTRDPKFQLGAEAQRLACETVLAKMGAHAHCKVAPDPMLPCDGPQRTVSVRDLQQIAASDGEQTYQPGVFEIARRNVYATWICVSSMFKDC